MSELASVLEDLARCKAVSIASGAGVPSRQFRYITVRRTSISIPPWLNSLNCGCRFFLDHHRSILRNPFFTRLLPRPKNLLQR